MSLLYYRLGELLIVAVVIAVVFVLAAHADKVEQLKRRLRERGLDDTTV
jgi:methylmalonyl-CoA mutase cobalamin-binding subunit